jgi:hypothetical protein
LFEDRSSNGKGTRTTLPLIIERLAVIHGVNVFSLISKEGEGRVTCRCPEPFGFVDVFFLREKDDYTYTTGTNSR